MNSSPPLSAPRVLLIVAGILALIILPRTSRTDTRLHTLQNGIAVSCEMHVNRFGFPIEWIDVRRPTWSAVIAGRPAPLADEDLREFAAWERMARPVRPCGMEPALPSLDRMADRRRMERLKTDPRAGFVVVRWGMLLANAFIGAGFLAAVRYARRQIAEETRVRRRRRGQCPSCGYSLTANLSGICPECGSEAPN